MKSEYWFVALILAMGVYEIYALITPRRGDTVSEIMWVVSQKSIVPFMCGLLAGHFFWPRG